MTMARFRTLHMRLRRVSRERRTLWLQQLGAEGIPLEALFVVIGDGNPFAERYDRAVRRENALARRILAAQGQFKRGLVQH